MQGNFDPGPLALTHPERRGTAGNETLISIIYAASHNFNNVDGKTERSEGEGGGSGSFAAGGGA